MEKWERIIFGDKNKLEGKNRKSKVPVERFKSEKYSNCFDVPSYKVGVNKWGCFNFNGVGLCNIYTGHINQHTHIEILKNCMVPLADTVIHQTEWCQLAQSKFGERKINLMLEPA